MAKKASVGLAGLSTSEIQRELGRRADRAKSLVAERNRLLKRIAKLDADIRSTGVNAGAARVGRSARASAGLTARGTPRKRAVNATGLAEALHKTLKDKTMGVTEVAKAVVANGYKTTAENFRTIVNQCLTKHRKLFKKVSRGQYTSI